MSERFIKSIRLWFLAAGALLLAGCSTSIYESSDNWAIADNDTPTFFSEYDLIFLYPGQEMEPESGYTNWVYGNIGEEIRRYVRMMISAPFGQRVRVFSPFIPMLGDRKYEEIVENFRKERHHSFNFCRTPLRIPIEYMREALEVYFSHFNPDGHPFVIFGQDQGALVLYEAMKRCSKVRPENGFVAAYFFGIPGVSREEIDDDFGSRGIRAAQKRNEVGVIAICNTRTEGEPLEETLALSNGAVINPLNWHVDAAPAGRKENPGSLFFNRHEPNPARKLKTVNQFCGATVDPENGLVNLTDVKPGYAQQLKERHFDSDVWGLFIQSVHKNAAERVLMYNFLKKGVEMPKIKD